MIPYRAFYWTIGIFLLLSVPFTECKKVHKLMTDNEIMDVFQTTRDRVPEYEIVAIKHSLHKRSTPQDFIIKFKAFDEYVTSYLNPINGFLVGENTPVWVSEKHGDKIHYRLLGREIMKEVLGVYQNVSDQAALVVRSRNGRDLQFRGTIQDLVITPLPDHVQNELEKTERTKRRASISIPVSSFHIVYKSTSVDFKKFMDQKKRDIEFLRQNNSDTSSRFFKDTVFPTILVTTDFDAGVQSENDNAYYDQILYQMAFWNGVDLRFRHLDNPRVRLRIAGLIIGSNRNATPYVQESMENGQVDLDLAYYKMQDYWSQIKRDSLFFRNSFHIVATRSLKMFFMHGDISREMLGRADIGSICGETRNTFLPSMLFRDNLSFDGINTAVHELGHIFGAIHDNENECPSEDGFLMSAARSLGLNNLKWSDCSLRAIRRTLRNHNCTDEPNEYFPPGKPLERVLPGGLMTADEQCRARGFDGACLSPMTCQALQCHFGERTGSYWPCRSTASAPEGTECEPGKYCINGDCLLP